MASEKILVVDDEDHIVELISYNLINSGYSVLTANNGIDAVRIAKEDNPNLILLDLMIP
ncbi:MAG: response regulator, partial [Clostridium sp.]